MCRFGCPDEFVQTMKLIILTSSPYIFFNTKCLNGRLQRINSLRKKKQPDLLFPIPLSQGVVRAISHFSLEAISCLTLLFIFVRDQNESKGKENVIQTSLYHITIITSLPFSFSNFHFRDSSLSITREVGIDEA